MRTHCARRRLLRFPQAVSQRGLLYRTDLSIHGLPGDHVPGSVRDPPHQRVDRPVGRDAARTGTEDRPSLSDLPWIRLAALCSDRSAKLTSECFRGRVVAFDTSLPVTVIDIFLRLVKTEVPLPERFP